MIIVEGTDLLGKTTLCHALVEHLNQEMPHIYQHFSKLPECFDWAAHYFPFMTRFVVMDRFYMSRQAYGRVFENQYVLSDEEYRILDAALRLVGGFTVVCLSNEKTIRERHAAMSPDRSEMYDVDGICKVNAQFADIVHGTMWDYDFDYVITSPQEGWPADHVKEIVEQYLDRQVAITQTIFADPLQGNRAFNPW